MHELIVTQVDIYHAAPRWGEHTDEMCRTLLALTDDEISSLKERGIIK
jgi:crotonobetainyl-CoA:carnitine CoA-transferase CaiB-like acyl-CoA transferase